MEPTQQSLGHHTDEHHPQLTGHHLAEQLTGHHAAEHHPQSPSHHADEQLTGHHHLAEQPHLLGQCAGEPLRHHADEQLTGHHLAEQPQLLGQCADELHPQLTGHDADEQPPLLGHDAEKLPQSLGHHTDEHHQTHAFLEEATIADLFTAFEDLALSTNDTVYHTALSVEELQPTELDLFSQTGFPHEVFLDATESLASTDSPLGLQSVYPPAELLGRAWPPPEADLIANMEAILADVPPARQPSPFRHDLSPEAAAHNLGILQQHEFDLERVLRLHNESPIAYGSEFRSTVALGFLFSAHPDWELLREVLSDGIEFPLSPLPETERQVELEAMLRYGNHKSALQNRAFVADQLREDTEKGYYVPFPIDKLHLLPKVAMAPLGCAEQHTIDSDGNRVPTRRVTNDLTFGTVPNRSVNDRTLRDAIPPCRYGFALLRMIHWIVSNRLQFPGKPILLAKQDFKSAFRRLSLRASTALECCVQTKGILDGDPVALLGARLSFGPVGGPGFFSGAISEPLADLSNVLARCQSWDPLSLSHSYMDVVDLEPELLSENMPFAEARSLSVDPEPDGCNKSDPFIDDILNAVVMLLNDDGSLAADTLRGIHAPLMAFDLMARPLHPDEPLRRQDMLALTKAFAEGKPREISVMLGWTINSRTLEISLPPQKWIAWKNSTKALLECTVVPFKQLESLVGCFNHVGCVVRLVRHFLDRLHHAVYRGNRGKTQLFLTNEERKDLCLFLQILDIAHGGIPMNLLVFREPTVTIFTDACTYGIGGFCFETGRAWRLFIPEERRHHINTLEFLAAIVGILLELEWRGIGLEDCVLSYTDNTTALGWLHKTKYLRHDDSSRAIHLDMGRFLAATALHNRFCLTGHHIPGIENCIADRLSRDHTLDDSSLTSQLLLDHPEQVPPHLCIRPIPNAVFSVISSLLPIKPSTRPSSSQPTTESRPPGDAGFDSWNLSASTRATPFSMLSPERRIDTPFFVPSPKPSEATSSANPPRAMRRSRDRPPAPPSNMWVRSLQITATQIPHEIATIPPSQPIASND